MNDTIVIYDRVRENMRSMRRDNIASVVNAAVNQMLDRTMITGGLTLLSVIALFFFGGEVLKGFAFTMIVGIITGTYSSVFIAAAIVVIWQGRTPLKTAPAAPVAPGAQVGQRARRHDSGASPNERAGRRRPRRDAAGVAAAALLGVVQGLTEFLPVSSSAHLRARRAPSSAGTSTKGRSGSRSTSRCTSARWSRS